MRKLAEKGGIIWVILGIVPTGMFIYLIGKLFNIDSNIILCLQLPALLLQLFGLFMVMVYKEEVLK